MKKIVFFSILFCLLALSARSETDPTENSSNVRLILQGAKVEAGRNWGITGYAISPNLTKNTGNFMAFGGFRLQKPTCLLDGREQKPKWWLDLSLGDLIKQEEISLSTGQKVKRGYSVPLFDLRLNQTINSHFSSFVNFQWFDLFRGQKGYLYGYGQLKYSLGNFLKVGLETENTLKLSNRYDYSIGPDLVFNLPSFFLVIAYQWHKTNIPESAQKQVWLRFVVNL